MFKEREQQETGPTHQQTQVLQEKQETRSVGLHPTHLRKLTNEREEDQDFDRRRDTAPDISFPNVDKSHKKVKTRAVKVSALIDAINLAAIHALKYFNAINATLFTSGVRCPLTRNHRVPT